MNYKDNSLLNELYAALSQELDISETMRGKAERAYTSVAEWIDGDTGQPADVFVQGSFALGTVTRPVSGEDDDYDIDLVSELPGMTQFGPRAIKHHVGNRLKEHGTYAQKLEPEGKRCWTLQFDEFHMDVLPCTPDSTACSMTAITLTNREPGGEYTTRSSDPRAYQSWFERRMGDSLAHARRRAVGKAYASVDKVPTFAVATPLQMAIRILKHHRDVMFEGRDDAPISIIITTLAALSYDQQVGVFDTVSDVLGSMSGHIRREGGLYVIENPVDPKENFADRWNTEPWKARAYFDWASAARRDLVDKPLGSAGIDALSDGLKGPLSENVVVRAFSRFGNRMYAERQSGALRYGTREGITLAASATTVTVPSHRFYGA